MKPATNAAEHHHLVVFEVGDETKISFLIDVKSLIHYLGRDAAIIFDAFVEGSQLNAVLDVAFMGSKVYYFADIWISKQV